MSFRLYAENRNGVPATFIYLLVDIYNRIIQTVTKEIDPAALFIDRNQRGTGIDVLYLHVIYEFLYTTNRRPVKNIVFFPEQEHKKVEKLPYHL